MFESRKTTLGTCQRDSGHLYKFYTLTLNVACEKNSNDDKKTDVVICKHS